MIRLTTINLCPPVLRTTTRGPMSFSKLVVLLVLGCYVARAPLPVAVAICAIAAAFGRHTVELFLSRTTVTASSTSSNVDEHRVTETIAETRTFERGHGQEPS